jgi:hypothetical protein
VHFVPAYERVYYMLFSQSGFLEKVLSAFIFMGISINSIACIILESGARGLLVACMFGDAVQGAFQKCFSIENVLK